MSGRPTVRRSWRWVPSPQSNSRRSPPRRRSTAGMPRRAVGTEPAVPAKNSDRSIGRRRGWQIARGRRRAPPSGARHSVGTMLREFRSLLLRGNLVELAVAVVVGTAFTAVVNALVKDLITPLIAAVGGKADFGALAFTINHSRFAYGDFLNALLTFLIVAAVVFFLVLKPVNALMARTRTEPDVESPTRDRPECLSAIPMAARRCAFCTAAVPPMPA